MRLAQRPALEVPAGQQAIDRRDVYTLTFSSGRSVTVGVPDEVGALVAKGAAYLTGAGCGSQRITSHTNQRAVGSTSTLTRGRAG